LTEKGEAGSIGFDGGKLIKGRKRHLLVDTFGLYRSASSEALIYLAVWIATSFGHSQEILVTRPINSVMICTIELIWDFISIHLMINYETLGHEVNYH
jgi:hypothetical protein